MQWISFCTVFSFLFQVNYFGNGKFKCARPFRFRLRITTIPWSREFKSYLYKNFIEIFKCFFNQLEDTSCFNDVCNDEPSLHWSKRQQRNSQEITTDRKKVCRIFLNRPTSKKNFFSSVVLITNVVLLDNHTETCKVINTSKKKTTRSQVSTNNYCHTNRLVGLGLPEVPHL